MELGRADEVRRDRFGRDVGGAVSSPPVSMLPSPTELVGVCAGEGVVKTGGVHLFRNALDDGLGELELGEVS